MTAYERILKLIETKEDSVFLWGARQTGKSTLLAMLFHNARYYDLLKPATYERLSRHPNLLIDELMSAEEDEIIIIDEVQKLPSLLDSVQWLMVNRHLRFVLCGSSARKLKRVGANMLGGRAVRCALYPFVSAEIPDFDLLRAVNNGMLPRHYMTENAEPRLRAYVGDYLQEEIRAEALTRNLASFTRFLEVAALTDGEIVSFQNIAAECGISAPTVKEYFSILSETLIGYMIPAFTLVRQRRLIKAPKFYYFDVGIVNYLCHRKNLRPGSSDFGHAFEHFIIQELIAYLGYAHRLEQLSYWRTASGYEVDAIVSDVEVAIEIKSSEEVQSRHLRGLKALAEEHPSYRLIIVSLDEAQRITSDVEVWPAMEFLKELWKGSIL